MTLEQPIVKSSRYGLNPYGYEGIKLWNRLKNEMKCEVDLKQFKLLLRTCYPVCVLAVIYVFYHKCKQILCHFNEFCYCL